MRILVVEDESLPAAPASTAPASRRRPRRRPGGAGEDPSPSGSSMAGPP